MTTYATVVDNIIIATSSFPNPGMVIVPDGAHFGDAWYGTPPVLIKKPSPFHYWETDHFELDLVAFNFELNWVLPSWRDSATEILISYDTGTEIVSVTNNARTRQALVEKMNYLPLLNDPLLTTNFLTEDGWKVLTAADLQGLFVACSKRQQDCFDAMEAVQMYHENTPFEFMSDAEDFFLNVLSNL